MRQTRRDWTVREVILVGFIAVIAIAIRIIYVNTAVVDHPLRGDTLQYFAYALNLVDHHVFSLAPPGTTPTPDGFRDPGYPAMLAIIVELAGREQPFYLAALNAQALMSAATVIIYTVLARRWTGIFGAAFVGIGLSFWPHTITLAGYLLSETLMGFLIAIGLWLTQRASEQRHVVLFALAGFTMAVAALTNLTFAPVVVLFTALYAWKDRRRRKLWAVMFIAAALPLAGWMLRSASLPSSHSSGDRIAMNFVQGSWPEYHDAWRASIEGEPSSIATIARIDSESHLLSADLLHGLREIGNRMSGNPARYIAWYARKPLELWGWAIGVGSGDIYVFPTFSSPLSGTGLLRATTDVLFLLSPLLLAASVFGIVLLLVSDGPRVPPSLCLALLTVVVITFVFAVLQCDARYSTPYRGIEWALAAVTLGKVGRYIRGRRQARTALAEKAVTDSGFKAGPL